MKTCQVCGKEFLAAYGSEKFCSKECRDVHRNEIARAKFKIEYIPKIPKAVKCIFCGSEFVPRRAGTQAKYCSEECKNKAKYEAEIIQEWGSVEAWQNELERRKDEARREKIAQREASKVWYEGTCKVCGAPFKTLNPSQKTCSKECSKRLQYGHKLHRIPKDQIVDKDITLEALYRRDSGVCYLCGKPCDWNDRDAEHNICGKNYPSIDHLIPVSRGGKHSWDNVRLAHCGCNSAKSNDIIEGIEKMVPKNAFEFKREPKTQKKTVLQYNRDGTLVGEYPSTAEAERQTGIKQKGIQNCARGEIKTYRGFRWVYRPSTLS